MRRSAAPETHPNELANASIAESRANPEASLEPDELDDEINAKASGSAAEEV